MQKVFCIRNKVTGYCNRPMYCTSVEECKNIIQNVLVTDKDKALFGLRDKLELLYVGEWDDVNGLLLPFFDDKGKSSNAIVCTIEDIFDSIPEEFLKPALTRDDIIACVEKIKDLKSCVNELSSDLSKVKNDFSIHTHPVKKGVPYVQG